MSGLTERCAKQISGVLGCLDRVVIQGTLPTSCYADGMTRFLNARHVRIFDDFDFTKPLKEGIRQNAEQIAGEAGIEKIEFIRKLKAFRKEDRIQEILAERGDHPGLVHVFSAMEICTSYQPWHDKQTHRTFLKPDSGKLVDVFQEDLLREPKLGSQMQPLREPGLDDEIGYLNCLTNGACPFLGGENRCGIYPTRPVVCVLYPAGSEECQEARQKFGFPV